MPVIDELDIALEQKELPPVPQQESRKAGLLTFRLLRAWLRTVVTTVVLFLIVINFLVQGFCVFGSCMEPNLRTGERVLGNKLVYRFKSPARGDIVVFRYPLDPKKTYIKRVIGLPGEIVEIRGGRVFINSEPLAESYVVNTPHGYYGPERVEQGKLFVMGDYRDQSNDSRYWGELPMKNIQAKAWIRYWPVRRLDIMK